MPEKSPLRPQATRTRPLMRRLVRGHGPIARGMRLAAALALVASAVALGWQQSARSGVSAGTTPETTTVIRVAPDDLDSLATAYAKRLVMALAEISPSGDGRIRSLYEEGVLQVQSLLPDAPSPSGLAPLERQRIERIVDAMDRQDRRRLLRDEIQLYDVTLRDSEAEDGDLVSYDVDGRVMGFAQLVNATRHVAVPVGRGQPTEMGITGVFDGGGGITLGVVTREGETFIGSIAPMERVTFRVMMP